MKGIYFIGILIVSLLSYRPVSGQGSNYYFKVPFTAQDTLRAATVTDIDNRQYPRVTRSIEVAENTIEIGDTLRVTVTTADLAAVKKLILELKFCYGNCVLRMQARGIATEGYVVAQQYLNEQKTNTIDYVIGEKSTYPDELGNQRQVDNANLKEMYVVLRNTNRLAVPYTIRVEVAKKRAAGAEYSVPSRYVPSLPTARYHAVLVGVTNYQDQSLSLKSPGTDVSKLEDVLLKNYEFSTITKLIDPPLSALRDTLMTLSFRLFKEDNLLLFFAGHGLQTSGGGYWGMHDSRNGDVSSFFSNDNLTTILKNTHVQHLLVIADACYGSSLMARRAFTETDKGVKTWEEAYTQTSRHVLSSSSQAEVPDSSIFMQYLVDRLRSNREPYLTASELFESLKYPLFNNTPHHQRPKFGDIDKVPAGEGEFLFKRKTATSPVTLVQTGTRGIRAVVPEITNVVPEPDSLKTGNIDYVHAVQKAQPPFLTRELSDWLPDTGVTIVNDTGSPVPIKLSVEPGKWADFKLGKQPFVYTFPSSSARLELRTTPARKFQVERGGFYRVRFNPATQSFELKH
ncbi:MAG: caspase family protein [Sphingobacteriaceae bacterium]|nr:caspase family protein [Cytophagaceae bacterium]